MKQPMRTRSRRCPPKIMGNTARTPTTLRSLGSLALRDRPGATAPAGAPGVRNFPRVRVTAGPGECHRSIAVAKWLVGKGVDCKRLLPVGFGQEKPIADNKTAEGREQNRRTAFVNAELRKKPIGGMPVDGGGKVAGDPCK